VGSRLSPISDAGYSETSTRTPGPPRPPKVKDNGPLIPERPPKVPEEEEQTQAQTQNYSGDRVASRVRYTFEPAVLPFTTLSDQASISNTISLQSSAIRSPPTRKPTGPRPLTSGGAYSPSNIKRKQYRGSPMQIDYDDDY
jgi:hypothetical protein